MQMLLGHIYYSKLCINLNITMECIKYDFSNLMQMKCNYKVLTDVFSSLMSYLQNWH